MVLPIYIYIYTYICTYTHIYTINTHTYIHTYLHTYMCYTTYPLKLQVAQSRPCLHTLGPKVGTMYVFGYIHTRSILLALQASATKGIQQGKVWCKVCLGLVKARFGIID